MIRNIKIRGLYSIYNYHIDFSNEDNVRIITGPNGFGKTTILQIINHICSAKFGYFYFLPFESISILFSDDVQITVCKSNLQGLDCKYRDVIITMIKGNEKETAQIDSNIIKSFLSRRLFFPKQQDYSTLDEDSWEERFSNQFDEQIRDRIPNMLTYLQTIDCVMVEEQRIVSRNIQDRNREIRTVDEIQRNIHEFFIDAQKTYNSASLRIDGSFVKRLSDIKPDNRVKQIKRERIYQQVIEKIADFKRFGLVGELEVVSNLGVHYNDVLKLYLTDLFEKLSSIDYHYDRLSTFHKLVSGKHLSYKYLRFEKDTMTIIDTKNQTVPIRKLSSGEQNLLVLCYKLVFEMQEGDILLVDEPENSMHMAWLEDLLDDYIRIAKKSGCQVIIATHSPAFIHGRWDLTYDLCEYGTIQESKRDNE